MADSKEVCWVFGKRGLPMRERGKYRRAMRLAVEEEGSEQVARKLGMKPSYLVSVVGGSATVSARTAAAMEAAYPRLIRLIVDSDNV